MYESYWLLDTKPFENTPDPHFMFNSEKHQEALMRLLYAVHERKEGALLTGEYGSGKTLLSRALFRELENDRRYRTVLILNPNLSLNGFLKEILYQLGVEKTAKGGAPLQRQLEEELNKIAATNEGMSTVIIVDEAHMINAKDFNELRLLLNFRCDDRFLFTLLLVGPTSLKKKILGVEPLRQRLATRFHLDALSESETEKYIHHRLKVAGRQNPVFTHSALKLVYQGSEGIPRRINNICDYSLLIGYGRKTDQIGVEIVTQVLKDLDEWREDMHPEEELRAKKRKKRKLRVI